jgi:zinc protease
LGGADQFEPTNRRGVAGLAASMLSEGTTTRDGEALSNALQTLGTSVQLRVDSESGMMGFVSTSGKFAPTLDLLADMLLRSTFPAPALERLRAQRLVALNSSNAQPGAIASRVFPKVLYGTDHPFGQLVTEETLKAITRDDVVAFHKNYFQPGRAAIVVVGDVTPASAKAAVEKALAAWPAGGSKPAFTYPPLPAAGPTTIYLVDKPGAAQSTFAIGVPGPPRKTPDFFALQVMNTLLGGMFQSRLNANIREEKGLSYGVNSRFAFGKGPGPFRAGGDIISAKSDVALTEFMKEFRGIQGSRPVTDDELQMSKNSLAQSLPERFASVSGIGDAIGTLWQQGLPDDYYQQYQKAINAVTKADLVRVAKQYIDLEHLSIVIVGDRATIEGPLKATGIAPIVGLDIEGTRK